MIIGKKHVWCGRINWDGKEECTCRPYGNAKEMYQWVDVVLDNQVIEDLGKKARALAEKLGMKVTIGYDTDQDNEQGDTVGALILDGWITIYPEKIEMQGLGHSIWHDGFGLDVTIPEHNYPHEPDFEDYVRLENSTNAWTILSKAMELIWKQNLNNIIEGIGMEEAPKDIPF